MPFPFESITVSRADALQTRQNLLNTGRGYPIILDALEDDQDRLDELFEEFEDNSTDELLAQSQETDASQALLKHFKDGCYRDDDDREVLELPHGTWPDGDIEPTQELCFSQFNEEAADDTLQIVLIPTQHGWQVPCYLKLGGWNACPFADLQSAVLRDWEQRYGAQLIVVGPDTLELTVERPPTTREEALKLAEEQYYFCSDIVDQGVGTIENLAAALLNGKTWFFWWD